MTLAAAPLCLVGFKERGFSRGEGNRNPSPLEWRFAILEPIYDPAVAVINGRGGARERAQFSSPRRKRSLAHFATTSRHGQSRSVRRPKYSSKGRAILSIVCRARRPGAPQECPLIHTASRPIKTSPGVYTPGDVFALTPLPSWWKRCTARPAASAPRRRVRPRPRKFHIPRFRRGGESSFISLLVLSPTRPLRWVALGAHDGRLLLFLLGGSDAQLI